MNSLVAVFIGAIFYVSVVDGYGASYILMKQAQLRRQSTTLKPPTTFPSRSSRSIRSVSEQQEDLNSSLNNHRKQMESILLEMKETVVKPIQEAISRKDASVKPAPIIPAFHAHSETGFDKIGTPITYEKAMLNTGNGMDIKTGVFKASVGGNYHFKFSTFKKSSEEVLVVRLMRNTGDLIAMETAVHGNLPKDYLMPINIQATFYMGVGATASVVIAAGSTADATSSSAFASSFSGFLISNP